ncbi:MAG: sugar phosphate isomerase/epimerase [Betaproteobacteria bacterium]|nr:sugar phosphate isomerase/epimerase [Betaproteobacteria bacterium]
MAAPDPDLLALNAATVKERWGLGEIIAGCVRHRLRGIAPLREQVQQLGLKETARRCRDAGLAVTGLCRGGLFPALDGKARSAARDDNRRAVDEALELDAQCLIVVAGGLPRRPDGTVESKDLAGARAMVRDGLGELLDYARSGGMPLAIEPLHPMYAAERGCVNTMAQANDLCDELAGRNKGEGLGLAVDVYHVWWDPLLKQEIERAANASPSRLLAFQISDWLAPTAELRLNRGMMGDGVIDLPLLRSWMENAGYHGMHEIEILSANHWWKRDPDEVLLTCRHRHQSAC